MRTSTKDVKGDVKSRMTSFVDVLISRWIRWRQKNPFLTSFVDVFISRWIRCRQKKQRLTSIVDVLNHFTVNQMTTEEAGFDVFCWRSHLFHGKSDDDRRNSLWRFLLTSHFTVTQMPIEDAAFDVFCWRSHSFHSEPNDNRRGSRPQYKYFCTSKRV